MSLASAGVIAAGEAAAVASALAAGVISRFRCALGVTSGDAPRCSNTRGVPAGDEASIPTHERRCGVLIFYALSCGIRVTEI